jgi:hypothetical protein
MNARVEGAGGGSGDAVRSADYIADLTKELAMIARGSRLDMLAYLLDIAHLEASERAGRQASAAPQLARPARG